MIFHENRLLSDDSHVISYLNFVENWERCRKSCRLLVLTYFIAKFYTAMGFGHKFSQP